MHNSGALTNAVSAVNRRIPALKFILRPFTLILTTAFLVWSCSGDEKPLEKFGTVAMIPLTTPDGEVLSSDYFSSGITVVEFIFTSCRGACPIMNSHMIEVVRQLNPALPVQVLSVSVDPDRDTGKRLAEFQADMDVDPSRWTFARGNQDAIRRWIENQFHLGTGALPAEHPTRFILVDRNREIRGYFDGLSKSGVIRLLDGIHRLLSEEAAQQS